VREEYMIERETERYKTGQREREREREREQNGEKKKEIVQAKEEQFAMEEKRKKGTRKYEK